MTVRYSRRSLTQIANIIAAFAVDDPPTATMFARRVETLARLLASHPSIGRQTDFAGIRVLPMKPYPYLIFYQPDPAGAGITVLRVRHMARDVDWRTGR